MMTYIIISGVLWDFLSEAARLPELLLSPFKQSLGGSNKAQTATPKLSWMTWWLDDLMTWWLDFQCFVSRIQRATTAESRYLSAKVGDRIQSQLQSTISILIFDSSPSLDLCSKCQGFRFPIDFQSPGQRRGCGGRKTSGHGHPGL